MPVHILPPEEQRRRSLAIQTLNAEWSARQIEAGIDGPVPDDRMAGSDYNQHVPALEADGAALDDYFGRLDEILRGGE